MKENGKPYEIAKRDPVAAVMRLRGGDVLKRPGASPLKGTLRKDLALVDKPKPKPEDEPLSDKVNSRDVRVIGGDADEVAGTLAALTIPKLDRPDTKVHVVGLDARVSNDYVKAVAEKHPVRSGEISPDHLFTRITDPDLAADLLVGSMPDEQNESPRKVEKNIVREIVQTVSETKPYRQEPPSLTEISNAMLYLMKDERSKERLTTEQRAGLREVFGSRVNFPGFQDMLQGLQAQAHELTSAQVKEPVVTGEDPRFLHYALQGNGTTPDDQISMLTRTLVHQITRDEGDVSVVRGEQGLYEVRMNPIVVIPRIDKLKPEKQKKILDPLHEAGIETYTSAPRLTEETELAQSTALIFMHSPQGPDATRIADLIGQEHVEKREQSYNSGGHKDTSTHKDWNKGSGKNKGGEGGGKNVNKGKSGGDGTSEGKSFGSTVNHRDQLEHVVEPEELQHLMRGTGIVFEGGTLAPFSLQKETTLIPTTPFREQLANLFPDEQPAQMTEAEYKRSLGVSELRNYPFGATWREKKEVDRHNTTMKERYDERHIAHIQAVQSMLQEGDFRGEDFISPAGTFTAPSGRMSDHRREILRAFRDQPIGVQHSVLSRMAHGIRSAEYSTQRAVAIDKANLERQQQNGWKATAVPAQEVPGRQIDQQRKAIGQ